MIRKTLIVLAAAFTLAVSPVASEAQGPSFGSVHAASNSPTGNSILSYFRWPNGQLIPIGQFPTGGSGTGGGLGNQGGIIFSENGRWLMAVNAGSDNISVFLVGLFGELYRTDVESSVGTRPVSLTEKGGIVYVLNGGGAGNIQGFRLNFLGRLVPIAGSSQPLSGAATTGPAQIQFDQSGRTLVVTEKATNLIDTYSVNPHGVASAPVVNASEGTTPFGFDFTASNKLIVSEAFGGAANASAVSSYSLASGGTLQTVSDSVPTMQSAACWIEITKNDRYAYTTNTASGTISGYTVTPSTGALSLLDAGGITATTGAGPIDLDLTRDSRVLFVLSGASHEINSFRVNNSTGSLTPLATISGLPVGANGVLAR